MEILEQVSVDLVQDHLRATGSGILVGDYGMPSELSEYTAFRVMLNANDGNRLFIWHEHRENTHGRSYFARDVHPAAANKERVSSFINGKRDLPTIDLRTATNLEVVMVSNDADVGPLSIIDGNHRTLAQFLMYHTIENVPGYVAVHPEIIKWWNLPAHVRR